jgi:3-oxoacyl-[acyl-carrier protein] reductase
MKTKTDLTTFLTPTADQRIVIAGGAGGIGFALTEALCALGADVAVMDLPQSLARRTFPANTTLIEMDVRYEASVDAAFAALPTQFAELDGLINVFGYTGDLAAIEHTSTATWLDMHDGNLHGVFFTCRAAMPYLRRSSAASVINFSTGIAQIGAAGYAPYATAKAGINALTRILAAEAAPTIRVNAIAPGGIDTAFLRGGFGHGGAEDGAPKRISIEDYAKRVPLGRIGNVDDVVGPTLFLLSPASRYITGQVLHVNGGALMRD